MRPGSGGARLDHHPRGSHPYRRELQYRYYAKYSSLQ